MKTSLTHRPEGPWRFDEAVADVFDDMVERSIPLYGITIDLCCRQALAHLDDGDVVLDLGVATGETLMRLRSLGGPETREVGVDNSSAMIDEARAKLGDGTEFIQADLRDGIPGELQDVGAIFCLWTAMFIPLEHRQELFAQCFRVLRPGGRLFVAEKLRGQTAAQQYDMVREYREMKIRRGYDASLVDEKAESLEGVLVSLDAPSMKAMLSVEGFDVEEIVRYLGFAAWQCIPRK